VSGIGGILGTLIYALLAFVLVLLFVPRNAKTPRGDQVGLMFVCLVMAPMSAALATLDGLKRQKARRQNRHAPSYWRTFELQSQVYPTRSQASETRLSFSWGSWPRAAEVKSSAWILVHLAKARPASCRSPQKACSSI
jgi:hypothetical protein